MRRSAPSDRRAVAARVVAAVTVVLLVSLWGAGCGDDSSSDAAHAVTRQVVSHETTQDILLFTPDGVGTWPVVIALHGLGGSAEDMAETARRLAERGFVVFAPHYRTELGTEQGAIDTVRDLVCSGWLIQDIADEHGGDPGKPLTLLGWSLGATFALEGGLTEDLDPDAQLRPCHVDSPLADLVVAVAGCYYEAAGSELEFVASGWSNKDVSIIMAVGEDDTTCAPWQSQQAAEELRSSGYDVDHVVFDGADHFSPFFLDFIDGELAADADHPAGDRLIDMVVDAVAAKSEAS